VFVSSCVAVFSKWVLAVVDTQLDVEHDSAASVEELAELRDLVDYSLEPLSESDLKGFGLKASSIIESAADPLVALRDISQNLPILARGISTTVPSEETKRRHLLNNQFVDEGSNIVLLNGQRVDVEAIDPFSYVVHLLEHYLPCNLSHKQ
jgi:hypothetical protein